MNIIGRSHRRFPLKPRTVSISGRHLSHIRRTHRGWRRNSSSDPSQNYQKLVAELDRLERSGRNGEAHTLAEKAVPEALQAYGKDHPEYAFALSYLAALKGKLNQVEKAISLYAEAEQILTSIPSGNLTPDQVGEKFFHLYSFADLLKNNREVHRALCLVKKIIDSPDAQGVIEATEWKEIYMLKTLCHLELKQQQETEQAAQKSLEFAEQVPDTDELEIAGINVVLGMALYNQKKFQEAIPPLMRAGEIRELHLDVDNELLANNWKYLCLAYIEIGDIEKAFFWLRKTIYSHKKGNRPQELDFWREYISQLKMQHRFPELFGH